MTREELWEEHISFYEELVGKYKWEQEPMIVLVKHFIQSGLSTRYYPSTSHESLGLSTSKNYAERVDLPMVYITYQSKSQSFVVIFQQGQGKTVVEENCGAKIDSEVIARIEKWLIGHDNTVDTGC